MSGEADATSRPDKDVRRIRFAEGLPAPGAVLATFEQPSPSSAVLGSEASADAGAGIWGLDVTILGPENAKQGLSEWPGAQDAKHGAAAVYVRSRGVELLWHPARAVLLCDPDQVDVLLPAIAEFAHYEAELRRIEQEVAAAWGEIEQDKALAFDVTTADLRRGEAVGARMAQTLQRRIRLARIEPHMTSPGAELQAAARRLGEELREKSGLEARAEVVDGQIEVFEHIYEMASQRMSEYKAAREGHLIEWVIIALLGAEAVLMLVQTITRLHP